MMTDEQIDKCMEQGFGEYGRFHHDVSLQAAYRLGMERAAEICDELAEMNREAPTDSLWQWGECAAAIRAAKGE